MCTGVPDASEAASSGKSHPMLPDLCCPIPFVPRSSNVLVAHPTRQRSVAATTLAAESGGEMQAVSSVRAARVALARQAAARSSRGARLVVQAKVDLQGGPRVVRGKCYVTKDVSLR